jgi:hypothetical protein
MTGGSRLADHGCQTDDCGPIEQDTAVGQRSRNRAPKAPHMRRRTAPTNSASVGTAGMSIPPCSGRTEARSATVSNASALDCHARAAMGAERRRRRRAGHSVHRASPSALSPSLLQLETNPPVF